MDGKKVYVVDNTEGGFKYIYTKSFIPDGAYPYSPPIDKITGLPEDPRWIQLENIIDPETGLTITKFTVDEVKKSSILQSENQAKQSLEQKKTQESNIKTALLDKLIDFNPDNVRDLNSIIDFIKDVKSYFDFKYRRELAERKKQRGIL